MSAIQYNKPIEAYHKRKKEEGKKGFITMNNVKNKLIHQIFAVIKSKKPFENDYIHASLKIIVFLFGFILAINYLRPPVPRRLFS